MKHLVKWLLAPWVLMVGLVFVGADRAEAARWRVYYPGYHVAYVRPRAYPVYSPSYYWVARPMPVRVYRPAPVVVYPAPSYCVPAPAYYPAYYEDDGGKKSNSPGSPWTGRHRTVSPPGNVL